MKTTLSFHGTRNDVVDLISPWISELQLTLVYEEFFPKYRAKQAESMSGGGSSDMVASMDRLSLHLDDADLSAGSPLGFIDRNPDGLSITFGAEAESGLRVSRLGAGSEKNDVARTWKKLRDRARKSMLRGAWIINMEAGARVRDDSHLYTSGAKTLQDRGVPILGPSDWIRFELG